MEEELKEWLQKIKRTNKAVIVEGINDKKALESLGVKNIITLNKAVFEIIEDIVKKYKEVIILTDLDKKGKELYSLFKKGLEKNGVKVDSYFREFLLKNTELSHIEGLLTYLRKRIEL